MAVRLPTVTPDTGQRRPFPVCDPQAWRWAPLCFWGPVFFISKELDMNADIPGTTVAPTPVDIKPDVATETAAASRRDFIKKSTAIGGAAFFSTLGHSGVWAAGSDAVLYSSWSPAKNGADYSSNSGFGEVRKPGLPAGFIPVFIALPAKTIASPTASQHFPVAPHQLSDYWPSAAKSIPAPGLS